MFTDFASLLNLTIQEIGIKLAYLYEAYESNYQPISDCS